MICVGTAAWSIPRATALQFPGEGTHLRRYARVLRCAEINSSFYRSHACAQYARWAAMTPRNFRFSVKLPQTITHEQRLRRVRRPLEGFLAEVTGLGNKLGPLLVQLPPSLEFDARVARNFFSLLRELYRGPVVCEPRHASWFTPRAQRLLAVQMIGRVAADPAKIEAAAFPGGWLGTTPDGGGAVVYYRLHGSPRLYWSRYSRERIQLWAQALRALSSATQAWCIFDNTASGGAIENALELKAALAPLKQNRMNRNFPAREHDSRAS